MTICHFWEDLVAGMDRLVAMEILEQEDADQSIPVQLQYTHK